MPPSENVLRPKITIKSRDETTTLHTYNAHDVGAADINITSLSLNFALYEAPSATFFIEDSGNTLDSNVINCCRVLIDLGKTDGSLSRIFAGYIKGKQTIREDTGTFDMQISALGSQVRFTERISNFVRMAKRTAVNSANYDNTDTTMQTSTVFTDLLTKADHMPIGEPIENFTTNGVNTITEVIPGIKAQYREQSTIANEICNCVGATWGVDGNDDVFLRFPTTTPSGLTIKDTQLASDANNTAYIIGGWIINDTTVKEEGFANRLYGRGGTELIVDAYSATDTTSTSLHDRYLAIQFTPTETFNADMISVVLHKVGTITNKTFLQAVLCVDKSNSPGFSISNVRLPLEKIPASPGGVVQLVFPRNSSFMRNLQVDKPHWLQIKSLGQDASNTVYWHRDAGITGRNAYSTDSGATWTVQSSSYTFMYGQLQGRRVLTEASDGDSISKYGVVEAMIDADFINDGRTMDKYLSSILQFTAKPKRIIEIPNITIPDTLPEVGMTAELIDSKMGFAAGNTCEIIGMGFNFNASTNAMGANRMSIKLLQYPTAEQFLNRI